MEIEMFFAKYDLDGNHVLEEDEIKRMLADLEGQKVELESELIKFIFVYCVVHYLSLSLFLLQVFHQYVW